MVEVDGSICRRMYADKSETEFVDLLIKLIPDDVINPQRPEHHSVLSRMTSGKCPSGTLRSSKIPG